MATVHGGHKRVGHDFATKQQYIYMNHFALHLKLIHYKSTILQFEKEEKAIVTNLKASTQSIFPNKFNNFFLYEDYFKVSYLLLYSQQMT